MKFTKMQGTGNDFIVIEDFDNQYLNNRSFVKKLCDRHFGIGADGILFVTNSNIADIRMVIINSDGSYASMCGNGIRCFAKYVYSEKIVHKTEISVETGDGIKIAYLDVENDEVKGIKINMGKASFEPESIPTTLKGKIISNILEINSKEYDITSMHLGVPHTVVFGEIDKINISEGEYIENHEIFPQKTNVNFCEVVDEKNIKVKTWERGAGPTLACGTGSCAAAVACNVLGLCSNKINVHVPGGTLQIDVGEDVYMTGPAEISFKGEISL